MTSIVTVEQSAQGILKIIAHSVTDGSKCNEII